MGSAILAVAALYVALLLVAVFLSDFLTFPVRRRSYEDDATIIKLRTADGATISARYVENPQARYTMLLSHGNAEDLGDLAPFLEEMRERGFSVFAYDYHGFGTSQGSPRERTVYLDVRAAYEHLTKKIGIPPDRIIVHGRSVGTAASLELAAREKVAGAILESPFLTIYRVVTRIPLFPFDKFRNVNKIRKIACPVLVIHGTRDEVVPFSQGKRLFQLANEPKMRLWVDSAGHNDLIWVAGERYWQTIEEFARRIAERTGSANMRTPS